MLSHNRPVFHFQVLTLVGLFLVIALPQVAMAQRRSGAPGLWLKAAYTYSNFTYKEVKAEQKGTLPGVQGELGLGLLGNLAISAGGQYQDDQMHFKGTSLTGDEVYGIANNQVSDLRGLAHLFYGPLIVSGGVGQRYWYNDLETAYRQRTTYNYIPVLVTLHTRSVYIKGEYDIWRGGTSKVHLSDLDSARQDIDFKQRKGGGLGVELGIIMPNALGMATTVFVSYHKWTIEASDKATGGTDADNELTLAASTTTIIQGGIGLNF